MTKPKLFTKRHAMRVIYWLTVQTLPDGLETQFTPPDTTQTTYSLAMSVGRCECSISLSTSDSDTHSTPLHRAGSLPMTSRWKHTTTTISRCSYVH